jgi:hypothetical protein
VLTDDEGRFTEEGLFSFSGLYGPVRFALESEREDWYLKSVIANGVDVADGVLEPLLDADAVANAEIVIATGAAVSGRVMSDDDRPAFAYVVVFSTNARDWFHRSRRVKLAATAADGEYRAGGLPAGDYYVAAVDFIDPDPALAEWYDPDLLRSLTSAAHPIRLAESEQRRLTRRLVAW